MSEVSPPQKRRILFIGNSLTSHRGRSLDHIFRWGYQRGETIGGATLSDIQKSGRAHVLSVISSGSFHAVALQEDLPIPEQRLPRPVGIEHLVGLFRKAVAYFTSAIRPVAQSLFCTWRMGMRGWRDQPPRHLLSAS